MKKIVMGPFDGDIWSEVETMKLMKRYDPDTVVVYERGIPLTHVWFSQRCPRVVNATHGQHSNCTKPVKKCVGNIEIWNDIPLNEVCSGTNSYRPTLFYMDNHFVTPAFIDTLSKSAKDWILFIKNMSSLPDEIKTIMDTNSPGYLVYREPIQPSNDPRRAPAERLCVIDPDLVGLAQDLYDEIDGVNRSTCVEMHTQEAKEERTTKIVKLTQKI